MRAGWLGAVIILGLALAGVLLYLDLRQPLSCASMSADRAASGSGPTLDAASVRQADAPLAQMLDDAAASGHARIATNEASAAAARDLEARGWENPDGVVSWNGTLVQARLSVC